MKEVATILILAEVLNKQSYIPYVIEEYNNAEQKLTADELAKLIAIIKSQHPDNDGSGDIGYSITDDIITRLSGVNESLITAQLIMDGLENDIPKDVVATDLLTTIPEKLLKNKKLVQAILKAEPYSLTNVGYSSNKELTALIAPHITEEIALQYVKSEHANVKFIPADVQNEEIVRLALINGSSINSVNMSLRTLEMVILGGIKEGFIGKGSKISAKKYVDTHFRKEFDVTKGDLKSVLLGELSYIHKRHSETPYEVIRAIKLLQFKMDNRKIADLSDEVQREFLTNSDINNVARLTVHTNFDKRSTYSGASYLQYIPKEMFSKEVLGVIDDYSKKFLVNIKDLINSPVKVLTQEIVDKQMEYKPNNIKFVPKEFLTQEVCVKAVESDGSLLEFVPKNMREELYVNAVKNGGLKSIPEEDLTDRLCSLAIEANSRQFENVPETLKTYSICMKAVEADADNILLVPENLIDREFRFKAIESYLEKNNHFSGDSFRGDTGNKGVASFIHEITIKDRNNLLCDLMFKKPELFSKLVASSTTKGTALNLCLNMEICIEATRRDIKNVKYIPDNLNEEVWKAYLKSGV